MDTFLRTSRCALSSISSVMSCLSLYNVFVVLLGNDYFDNQDICVEHLSTLLMMLAIDCS